MTMIDLTPRQRSDDRVGQIVIYGNRWCGITQMLRRALERSGIGYEYVDLDERPDVYARLDRLAAGRLHTPVVYVDGEWLMEPSVGDVDAVLRRTRGGARRPVGWW
jgi:mycoredoxin